MQHVRKTYAQQREMIGNNSDMKVVKQKWRKSECAGRKDFT